MATYYIDHDGGNDGSDGLSEGAAKLHIPALSNGDYVIFKRGVVYPHIYTTTVANCTFTVNVSWGIGQAVWGANSLTDDWLVFVRHSGTVITGLSASHELKFTGTGLNRGTIGIFPSLGAISSITVAYAEFLNIAGAGKSEGIGVKMGVTDYSAELSTVVVSYCSFDNCYSYGVKISSGTGSTHDCDIHHNTFTNNGSGTDLLETNISSNLGNGAYDNSFHHNTLTAGVNSTDGIEVNNSPNKIYNNTFDGYRYVLRIDPSYNTNKHGIIELYSNLIKNSSERGINFGGTSTALGYVLAYNNLFENNGSYVINFPSTADNNEFYFNSFYQTGGHTFWFQAGATGNIVKNNIVFSTGDCYAQADATYSNNTENYNIFYRASGTIVTVGASNYTITQLAAYQAAATPNGANSLFSNPQYVGAPSDLTIPTGSPAKDAGINVGIAVDYLGNARPVGAGYDIGAYEYSSGSSDYIYNPRGNALTSGFADIFRNNYIYNPRGNILTSGTAYYYRITGLGPRLVFFLRY
jgi:hypothetical protein